MSINSSEPDWLSYFTPLIIFFIVVGCFIRFALKGCLKKDRPHPIIPEYIVWDHTHAACRGGGSHNHNILSRLESQSDMQSPLPPLPEPLLLNPSHLLGAPPKYEDVTKRVTDAPPRYEGQSMGSGIYNIDVPAGAVTPPTGYHPPLVNGPNQSAQQTNHASQPSAHENEGYSSGSENETDLKRGYRETQSISDSASTLRNTSTSQPTAPCQGVKITIEDFSTVQEPMQSYAPVRTISIDETQGPTVHISKSPKAPRTEVYMPSLHTSKKFKSDSLINEGSKRRITTASRPRQPSEPKDCSRRHNYKNSSEQSSLSSSASSSPESERKLATVHKSHSTGESVVENRTSPPQASRFKVTKTSIKAPPRKTNKSAERMSSANIITNPRSHKTSL